MAERPFYGATEAQIAEFGDSFYTLMQALEDADPAMLEDRIADAYGRFRAVVTRGELSYAFQIRADGMEPPDELKREMKKAYRRFLFWLALTVIFAIGFGFWVGYVT